ncbi:MAG: SIR2 family protein [Fibromonadales bacterium]|nr:SIR2 family protein [Fibromonadales bacterium]
MTHKEIINDLLDKKIAIFAGAGISRDSGLPIVSEFYDHFLPIFYDKEDVSKLKKLISDEKDGNIPFERMMEHIFSFIGNDYSIMDIFANGEPNTLHSILAQMMATDWATELYTTNFDCLIEQALEVKGFTKENYGYFYDEKGFAKLSKPAHSKNVIKIHGTIDKKESIRTTIETIASNENLIKRKPPIERLFSTGLHDTVLILGYSFSDKFDINEFIKKINVNKAIIVIDHKCKQSEADNVQLLTDKKDNNHFFGRHIDGYVINIDTLSFMSDLCFAKYKITPIANPKKKEWKRHLDYWASKFDSVHKKYIAGGICNAMNEFELGNKYITQAFKVVEPKRIDLYISIVNNYVLSRSRVRVDQKECDNLVHLCKDTIELLKGNKHDFPEDLYLKRLLDLTYNLGRIYEDGYFNHKEAIKYYFSVYRIEHKTNDVLGMSKTLHQIGSAYSSSSNLTSAIKCFKKSIKLKKKCGYIGGITRTYYMLASEIFRNNNKKLKQVEYYLHKAIESVHNVGETDLVYYINNLQGLIYMHRKAWGKAEGALKENISLLETQPHITSLSNANFNLARCEIQLKKYKNAIERLERNLQIVNNLGDKQNIFKHNQELAMAYLLSNNNEKCYQYLASNISFLPDANIVAKGYFYFYVALYYKKYNLTTFYITYLNLSKQCFQANQFVKDFNSLKKDFDKEIMPNKALVLDKDKYLLREELY